MNTTTNSTTPSSGGSNNTTIIPSGDNPSTPPPSHDTDPSTNYNGDGGDYYYPKHDLAWLIDNVAQLIEGSIISKWNGFLDILVNIYEIAVTNWLYLVEQVIVLTQIIKSDIMTWQRGLQLLQIFDYVDFLAFVIQSSFVLGTGLVATMGVLNISSIALNMNFFQNVSIILAAITKQMMFGFTFLHYAWPEVVSPDYGLFY